MFNIFRSYSQAVFAGLYNLLSREAQTVMVAAG